MATKKQTDPRKNFVPRVLPWLLASAVFVIYWLTMNHWVTPFNYRTVARFSGWIWQPEVSNPLFVFITWPLRWLPAAKIPVALNLFSAGCASLTLGLLARSVAILPQDRTDAQRDREHSIFSFLTTGSAWLPPFFAVTVCGLQMTFWEQATNCTPEMFDLLLFAFIVWSLLEYRLDEREGRLFLAASVYGAGMAENWAMIGFLPLFIAAIIWSRRLAFFNLHFLTRLLFFGLAGTLFYFLLPLLAVTSHKMPITFWQALKFNVVEQWNVVKSFFVNPAVRKVVLLLSLSSLLPLLVMAVRWKSSFGDSSKIGLALTTFLFHLIHAILLFICVWVAFDPPFSPRRLGFNLPFLTFYYLAALGIGYFTGYFLLIFGRLAEESSRSGPGRLIRNPWQPLNHLIFAAVWLFAAFAATGLIYKNTPQIRNANDDTLNTYGSLLSENLPAKGAICLSDDSARTFLLHAALVREGRAKDFLLVDTASLGAPSYHIYLHKKFPQIWPNTISALEQTNGISPLHLIGLLATLAKTNELYYLHPSFGYYFEQFCLQPDGLAYKMITLPNDTLLPPLPDKNSIAANEAFWSRAKKIALEPIIQVITPETEESLSLGEMLLKRFHVSREPNPNAAAVGPFYSRALTYWGVQLQRANELKAAAGYFETAKKLNPDNIVAQINLDFNQQLQAGQVAPVNMTETTPDKFGKYNSWNAVLSNNGPFDQTSFCFKEGVILAAQNGFYRQAVAPLARVQQLLPDFLPARVWLAQCYLSSRLSDRVLDILRAPMEAPEKYSATITDLSQLNILAAAAYFQKNDNAKGVQLVENEIARQPTNEALSVTAVQVYLKRGLYTNALVIIDRKLEKAPEDPTWLFGKGFASIQLKKYDDAIPALTRLLSIQPTNNDALFNRAVAYLQSGQLDSAEADYKTLHESFTNSFQVAYGLGEIAWRKHETNEAIENYEVYLANVNTNTAEATNIIERLKALQR